MTTETELAEHREQLAEAEAEIERIREEKRTCDAALAWLRLDEEQREWQEKADRLRNLVRWG